MREPGEREFAGKRFFLMPADYAQTQEGRKFRAGLRRAVPEGIQILRERAAHEGGGNYVYLVECADGTLYCGWTNDLKQRIRTHNTGKGAKYTRSRRPVRLVYAEEFESHEPGVASEKNEPGGKAAADPRSAGCRKRVAAGWEAWTMKHPKTVWITGASSGLGLHTAQALRNAGWTVIAGARSFSEPIEKDGIHCLPLDVTSPESVQSFCDRALEISPWVGALVQCAGMLVLGSCEETTDEEYLRVLNTNFLGMVRMNREVLPIMRAQKSGRIVMYSSINGLMGIPFQNAYTASKHAIEGYAEGAR